MIFSSLFFIFGFLPIFLICYYVTPRRYRNFVALIASYFFYAWGEPKFIFILFASSVIDYLLSLFLGKTSEEKRTQRQLIVLASLILNVGGLVYFKYTNFLVDQTSWLLSYFDVGSISLARIAFPIGISFFTFLKVSYIVDVYRGTVPPSPSFLQYALYVAAFPKLLAGPIVRYHDIAEQLENRTHTVQKFSEGIWRFSLGLGKKVLIANFLAVIANTAFDVDSGNIPMLYAWLGAFAYAFQIYFDFSGYSDMAIGLGRMIGFEFPENFNRPYISLNITEFWHRWHITLSAWMKEYLYIPLGGNRRSNFRTHVNLWIVFLISGFWHGASWSFIVWGAFHGLFLSLDRILRPTQIMKYIPPAILRVFTFLLVTIGWVFFRAETLVHGVKYLGQMFNISTITETFLPASWQDLFSNRTVFVFIAAAVISLMPEISSRVRQISEKSSISLLYRLAKFVTVVTLLFLSLCSLVKSDFNPFIYFRF